MRFFIIACLLFLIIPNCRAQSLIAGQPAFEKIKQLQQNKIDTIVLYHKSCGNEVIIYTADNCTEDDAQYLMWADGKESFLQKFDRCKVYEAKKIVSPILNLVKLHYATIEKQKFKPFIETKIINGEAITTELVNPSHGCSASFQIYSADKVLDKHIGPIPLTKQQLGHTNENYDYNKGLLTAQLKELIEDQINNYNK